MSGRDKDCHELVQIFLSNKELKAVAACKIVLNSRLHISANNDHSDFDFSFEHLSQINKQGATMMHARTSFDLSMAVLPSRYAYQMTVKNVNNINCSHRIFRKITAD